MALDFLRPVSRVERFVVLGSCILTIAALTLAGRLMGRGVPLGGFYLLPLAVAAAVMSRWAVFFLGIAPAFISEDLGPFPSGSETLQRLALAVCGISRGGLLHGANAPDLR